MMEKTTKYSVLIVDDELTNLVTLTDILEPEYEVSAIRDSLDVIETVRSDMPDVILLDIVMPNMDGYDVIKLLKKSKMTKEIPVIFITGLDDIEAEEKGLILGAADYIAKPFHAPIVKLRVRNQIKMLDQFRTILRLSMHDSLTGLPNRRNYESRLSYEWSRAQREQTPLSLLLIDVDNFKAYNDTFGHQQGDAALVSVVSKFNGVLKRPGDFAVRWGGEEFVIILPNTDTDGAMEVAEQLRQSVEEAEIPGKQITNITVSIGVNTWVYGQESTIDELMQNADTALYEAKHDGRNRIRCYNN